MKDRQFMVVLGLVVAAGLVMGLIAFRMTGGTAVSVAAGNAAVSNDGAPHPSPADEMAGQSADIAPASPEAGNVQNAEPAPPTTEPPEMQGPGSGDPPGTAAAAPSQPSAPAEASGDTIQ